MITKEQRKKLEDILFSLTPQEDLGAGSIETATLRMEQSNSTLINLLERTPRATKTMDDIYDLIKDENKCLENLRITLSDTMKLGFTKIEKTLLEKSDEALIKAFYDAIRPLVEQNVEKLTIMKSKNVNDSKVIGGGSSISSVVLRGLGAPKTGRKTNTNPGTVVQLASVSTPCRRVDITALPNNQAPIWYGDKNASAVSGSEQGTYLSNTNTATLSISDVSEVYFDVSNSGDGITWTAYN